MPRRRIILEPEPEPRKRSDYGTTKFTPKDAWGLPFVAQQRFIRYDTLAMWFAPDFAPPTYEPREPRKPGQPGPGRGGKRTGEPWPTNFDKRIAAVTRIVDERWVPHGIAASFSPFLGTPKWVRVTEAGLHLLNLDWPETEFPGNMRYYEHNLDRCCHSHCVNEIRVYLAGGGAKAPKHRWISERAIVALQPHPEKWQELPHLVDGYLVTEERGSWNIEDLDGDVLDTVTMLPGKKVAIEVELNQKSYPRLEKSILPSLLKEYDYVWYFCEPDAKRALIEARLRLKTDSERRRLRVMLLHEHLPHLLNKRALTPPTV
jgi:hypothetical protein